jgi:hypothetical protein
MNLADKHKAIAHMRGTVNKVAFFGSKEKQEETLQMQKEWYELEIERQKLEKGLN